MTTVKEHVKQGIDWIQEPRANRGYSLSETMNKAIPVPFRRADAFYHWHTDSVIPGFFLLVDDWQGKVDTLMTLLLMHPKACSEFGLTIEAWEALSGETWTHHNIERL
jgi:hypothetical protein